MRRDIRSSPKRITKNRRLPARINLDLENKYFLDLYQIQRAGDASSGDLEWCFQSEIEAPATSGFRHGVVIDVCAQ